MLTSNDNRQFSKNRTKLTSKNVPPCWTSSWFESGLFLQYLT